jgi:hypothetical protein
MDTIVSRKYSYYESEIIEKDTCIVFKAKIVDENGVSLKYKVSARYLERVDSLGVFYFFAPPGATTVLDCMGKKRMKIAIMPSPNKQIK